MNSDIVAVLTGAGPLGAILVACGLYLRHLHRMLKEVQDARVADAQRVVDRVLDLNDRTNEAIGGLTAAVDRLYTLLEADRTHRR
jgi:hypothetical protein